MSRKDPDTRLNSKIFGVAVDEYKKKHCAPGAKNYEVYSALSKVLPEPVEIDTIRLWRYRRNPAIGDNLKAVNQFLGIDCSLKTEEENSMTSESKSLTIQGQLILEIYRHIFNFVDSVTFDSTLDEIEGNYFDLLRETESRMAFLSPALKERVEKALDEIAVPLLNEDTFSAEYTPKIGHETPEGFFHVDNLPLWVRTHEELKAPFELKLKCLAREIMELI